MLAGDFGNAGGCVNSNYLFIESDHPQYKQMYAAALGALLGKQKITAYVHFMGRFARGMFEQQLE